MKDRKGPPMTFVGCEVDPKGIYSVTNENGKWVVRRNGVKTGILPPSLVVADGVLETATMLVGYGVFVSQNTFSAGRDAWASDWFPDFVDMEVGKL